MDTGVLVWAILKEMIVKVSWTLIDSVKWRAKKQPSHKKTTDWLKQVSSARYIAFPLCFAAEGENNLLRENRRC